MMSDCRYRRCRRAWTGILWVLYENSAAKVVRAKDLSETPAPRDTIEIGTAFESSDKRSYVDEFISRQDIDRIYP